MKKNNLNKLIVQVDMAGCPNRCRHCWLGEHKNGNFSAQDFREIAEEFKNWRDEKGKGIKKLEFHTWWREPDFRDDYRELWDLEQELSSPGCARRFELLSIWRLARDNTYAKWAATLEPKACQITFFGMEENTDWGVRRKGAFRDAITATERCIEAGISPRWQLFLTKKCMNELDEFLYLMKDLDLVNRCKKKGENFVFFIGGATPEGNGYEIVNLMIEEDDIHMIPKEMVSMSRDGISNLGKAEYKLLPSLLKSHKSLDFWDPHALDIDADYNIYTAIVEHTARWSLGNLKTDGTDKIIKAYRDCTAPILVANNPLSISSLAEKYGDTTNRKLYTKTDIIAKYLHQWSVENL